jgi:hypothetical protein
LRTAQKSVGVRRIARRELRGFFEHCGYGTPVQSL